MKFFSLPIPDLTWLWIVAVYSSSRVVIVYYFRGTVSLPCSSSYSWSQLTFVFLSLIVRVSIIFSEFQLPSIIIHVFGFKNTASPFLKIDEDVALRELGFGEISWIQKISYQSLNTLRLCLLRRKLNAVETVFNVQTELFMHIKCLACLVGNYILGFGAL